MRKRKRKIYYSETEEDREGRKEDTGID